MHRPRLPRPRLRNPLDADDARMLARLLVYSGLVVWVAVVLALAVGLFVRIVLAVS